MAKKINLAAMKTFFFKHGEKIALGTCVCLALFLGTLGLWRASGAGKADKSNRPWAEEFHSKAKEITAAIQRQSPAPLEPEKEALLETKQYEWKHWNSNHVQGPLINVGDNPGGDKRINPAALPLKRDAKFMQLDYVRGLAFVHDYNLADRTVAVLEGSKELPGMPMPPIRPAPETQPSMVPPTGSSLGQPVRVARPMRAVVGTMVFPMKEQVDVFRKALRLLSQKELFDNPDDLPRPLGFTLIRFEITPNGQAADPAGEVLIGIDPKTGKFKMSEPIRAMLRDSIFDEKTPEYLENYTFAGLSMPMPKMAQGAYPKPNLPGIDVAGWPESDKRGGAAKPAMVDAGAGGGTVVPGGAKNPMDMGKDKQPKAEIKKKSIKYKELKTADPTLADRLFGRDPAKFGKDPVKEIYEDMFVYHVLGEFPPKPGAIRPPNPTMPNPVPTPVPQIGGRFVAPWTATPKKPGDIMAPEIQPMPPMPPIRLNPDGQPEPGAEFDNFRDYDRDAVLRFIDPDVKPGKTYQYFIQVRLANPNFGKSTQVAYAALAKEAELKLSKTDSWVGTPMITIPDDYFLYTVDQPLYDEWTTDKVEKKPLPYPKDAAMFQIHQWIKRKYEPVTQDTFIIGDWAIAERLVVKRGDFIGLLAPVEVPVWRSEKDDFEMPKLIKDPTPTNKKNMKNGIMINLTKTVPDRKDPTREVELSPPVLVDFVGGRKFKTTGAVEEDVAMDTLVITPEGRLEVYNSRAATDGGPDSEKEQRSAAQKDARERQERVVTARRRAEEFRSAAPDPAKKGGVDVPMRMP